MATKPGRQKHSSRSRSHTLFSTRSLQNSSACRTQLPRKPSRSCKDWDSLDDQLSGIIIIIIIIILIIFGSSSSSSSNNDKRGSGDSIFVSRDSTCPRPRGSRTCGRDCSSSLLFRLASGGVLRPKLSAFARSAK
ncbi:unnamed protein product [Protopolystoma xenopodis]|uniref:Uncharacterized protein n=1 Tax=Protopolystoma xenopodis TaxID=117903 RepID=A0A3S5CGG0_9PLAT|nr:unnamed protein product [Protopolystoma xenopodis]